MTEKSPDPGCYIAGSQERTALADMAHLETDLNLILEDISRGNSVPFVGAAGSGGVPGAREMAGQLLAEIGYDGLPLPLAEAAQRYEMARDRRALIGRVREWLDSSTMQPDALHHLLAQLPFTFFFTIAQHCLLERALQTAGRRVVVVVRQEDTAYIDATRTTVVKLLGDVAQPESLVLTEKDHLTFLDRSPLLADVVRATLATRTLLFLDYDLSDAELRRLFFQVVRGQSRHKRSAYAVWPRPDEALQRYWADENLRFIDSDPVAFLQALHRQLARRPSAPQPEVIQPPALPRRPFRFLDPYGLADADLFAGRQQEITNLSQKVLAHHLVLLTGASGTGKTSLLQAGIAPRLTAEGWRIVYIRPLSDPLAALQRALEPLVATPLGPVSLARRPGRADRASDLRGLLLAAEAATQERLVIVLDQFEEFFLRLGAQAQTAFVAQLAPCLADPEIDTRFVLSLRDDFFLQLDALEAQIPGIFHNVFVLNRLRRDQALASVLEPLARVGVEIETGLADRIVADLDSRGVDPPQLQIVCDRLYDDMLAGGRRRITNSDYERLGGVEELLPAYLSDVLTRLPQAKPVLEALVGDEGLKATRALAEITRRVGDAVGDLPAVLAKLIEARLVRAVQENGDQRYELAHDVLATAIWAWLAEGAKEAERVRGLLERGLSDWRNSEALLDAQRLDFVAARWPFLGSVESEAQALLLRSAMRLGHDVPRWLERITDAALNRQVLLELSAHPAPGTRARVMAHLADLAGTAGEENLALATLRRAAIEDPDADVRRAAALALHQAQGEAAICYLAAQAAAADLTTRSRALGDLAALGDAHAQVWSHLGAGLRALVAAGVARLRLVRHWPRWGWRVAGAAGGGAIGFALGFALLYLAAGKGSLAIYAANYALSFGAVAGLLCGLGVALAAALADGDRPIIRAIGGSVGSALGCALGLQLWRWVLEEKTEIPLWPAGLLVGVLVGLGIGLARPDPKRTGLQALGGALAGVAGFMVAWPLFPKAWSPVAMSLMGALIGGMVGAGLAWADRQSTRRGIGG